MEAKLPAAAAAVQVVREAQLEAVPAAKGGERGPAMAAGPLSLARKRAAHRAPIDASLYHRGGSLVCHWQGREAVLLTAHEEALCGAPRLRARVHGSGAG